MGKVGSYPPGTVTLYEKYYELTGRFIDHAEKSNTFQKIKSKAQSFGINIPGEYDDFRNKELIEQGKKPLYGSCGASSPSRFNCVYEKHRGEFYDTLFSGVKKKSRDEKSYQAINLDKTIDKHLQKELGFSTSHALQEDEFREVLRESSPEKIRALIQRKPNLAPLLRKAAQYDLDMHHVNKKHFSNERINKEYQRYRTIMGDSYCNNNPCSPCLSYKNDQFLKNLCTK